MCLLGSQVRYFTHARFQFPPLPLKALPHTQKSWSHSSTFVWATRWVALRLLSDPPGRPYNQDFDKMGQRSTCV